MMVSASILSIKDNLELSIKELSKTPIDFIHLDIMDGKFVSNTTYSIDDAKKIIDNSKKLDVHLMVNDIEKYVLDFSTLNPEFITFHYEATSNIKYYIDLIKSLSIKVGIAINPETDVRVLDEYLKDIDLVLIMSVKPGAGGQKFIPSSIDKVKYLMEMKKNNNYSYLVSIDGGVNSDTIKDINTDIVVVGSFLTNGNYLDNYNKLKENMKLSA